MKGRSGDRGPRPTLKKYTQKKPRYKSGGIHEFKPLWEKLIYESNVEGLPSSPQDS